MEWQIGSDGTDKLTNWFLWFLTIILSGKGTITTTNERPRPQNAISTLCVTWFTFITILMSILLFKFFFIYSCHLYILQNKFEPRRIKEQRRMDPIARFLDNVTFYRCQRDEVLQIWSERWCTRAVIKWKKLMKNRRRILGKWVIGRIEPDILRM